MNRHDFYFISEFDRKIILIFFDSTIKWGNISRQIIRKLSVKFLQNACEFSSRAIRVWMIRYRPQLYLSLPPAFTGHHTKKYSLHQ